MANPQGAGRPSSADFLSSSPNSWDPICFEHEEPTPQCVLRAKRDIMEIFASQPAGVFIAPEDNDITRIDALILGPSETPYEGGFFHFLIKCPREYPTQPPRVRIMTTGGGQVGLNPNFHPDGKVCLSILGTWPGPAWSPALSIESVLVSIQSIMNENPYYNHPQFQTERSPGDVSRYNTLIQHETIRVAVCDAVEACLKGNSPCPAPLREVILKSFLEFYDKYESVVKAQLHLTGSLINDPFGLATGLYQYKALLTRLQDLKKQVNSRNETGCVEEKK
ncbi:hypothetical protein V5799_033578 [Amblyomma americanum]|uniref:Ubiquitin-conjugating enzyme E2 Z n=1 Tax=Amblyomma americanum TaxID=6943 RepID=A0AAQ4DMX3_AMBAM